jgi:hypothetical protein
MSPEIKPTFSSRICRVLLSEDGAVHVLCVGDANASEIGVDGDYKSTRELPEWLQDRLAVLLVCDAEPPTIPVPGVGRRIDDNTFWVHVDDIEPLSPTPRKRIGNINKLLREYYASEMVKTNR